MSERASAVFEIPAPQVARVRCLECADRACDVLQQVPGVAKVECDNGATTVRVEFDPGRITEADLAAELDRFGLELAEAKRHAAWRVTGLD